MAQQHGITTPRYVLRLKPSLSLSQYFLYFFVFRFTVSMKKKKECTQNKLCTVVRCEMVCRVQRGSFCRTQGDQKLSPAQPRQRWKAQRSVGQSAPSCVARRWPWLLNKGAQFLNNIVLKILVTSKEHILIFFFFFLN